MLVVLDLQNYFFSLDLLKNHIDTAHFCKLNYVQLSSVPLVPLKHYGFNGKVHSLCTPIPQGKVAAGESGVEFGELAS